MVKANPFTQEALNVIFKLSPADSERVISRESSTLEFKESFGWKSLPRYFKTCGAFANAKGGYVAFGIGNQPHKLVGLTGARLKDFQNIDPEKITEYFNEHFSPEILWDMQEYSLNGKTYGLLYVHESVDKPVVCTKDAEKELKEGDIYYRYRGRSERIKYPELRSILDQKRLNEQEMWMNHLSRIARIGVRDAGIFDLQTGEVTGTGGAFVIDESLLSQLSFIKEGEFVEVKGKSTLKLIGSVEAVDGQQFTLQGKKIVKTKGIRIGDIVLAFLCQHKVDDPQEYIKQICFENTAFLPVYYFMHTKGINEDHAIRLLDEVLSRSPAKAKLIERLRTKKIQNILFPKKETAFSKKRKEIVEQLKRHEVAFDLEESGLEPYVQAVRYLTREEVKKEANYLCNFLKLCFNKYYSSASGSFVDSLRRAICWIDEALYTKN